MNKTINHIDKNRYNRELGKILHRHRTLVGLTQQELAKTMGVTAQQIQKYEKAVNSFSSYWIYILGEIFGQEFMQDVSNIGIAPTVTNTDNQKRILKYFNRLSKEKQNIACEILRLMAE